MALLNFAFVFPEKELAAGFVEMSKRLKDFRKPLREAASDFEKDMDEQFRKEGRPKWSPLKPSTIQERIRLGYGKGPILQREGTLKRSLTTPGAKGHIREISKMSLVIGTDLKIGKWNLARIHTEGREDMAARPVMRVSDAALKRMMSRIHQYVLKNAADTFKGFGYVYRGG